ncbi:85/88 kDa calcium-independent phospholipase A2 [Mactra antiquata]
MASVEKTGRINMKHGFMKSIIKNQVDRDNYDKEVRATKQQNHPRRYYNYNNRPKRPDAAVYMPPKPTEDDWEEEERQQSSEDDDMPKRLFCFEFEDKDGKIYKQYVMEGVRAEILASRMGYDRKLSQPMIKALEQRLQQEIDKRTKS